jgi:long-chain acyl-CoA synthetase
MKKLALLVVSAAVAFPLAALAAEVAGVKLEDKLKVGPAELVLNGAGVRTRLVVKVYVGGLYLTEKKTTTADVLAAPGPKRVAISMLRDVGAATFNESLTEGFRNNNPPAEVEKMKPQLDEFAAIINALGEAKKGQLIALDFVPGTGTVVLVNGEAKGKPIAGDEFYRGLLRIWLGDRPADSDLKKGMLGQG